MIKRSSVKSKSGFVMLAIMFVVALMIPLAIAGAYFQLQGQRANFKRGVQDVQLNWMAWSAMNRSQFELRQLIAEHQLSDEGIFPEGQKVTALQAPMDTWLAAFKTNFQTFLGPGNSSDFSSYAVDNIAFKPCDNCFAKVSLNDPINAPGFASFTLESRVEFPAAEMTGAIRQMKQSLTVQSSNIANYSVFYYDNFVTNPGGDTTYGGPMYVKGNAFITPNKGTTLKLTFDTDPDNPYDPGTFALSASGGIFWFGPRALGQRGTAPNLLPPPVQTNLTKYYEADVYGKPVFYYYLSNNNPGWADENSNNLIDSSERSTILVKNNSSANFDADSSNDEFTEVIGNSLSAPTLRQYFERAKASKDITATYVPSTAITAAGSDVKIHTSLAYDPASNPSDFASFSNPNWAGFLETNFRVTPSGADQPDPYLLLRDNAPLQSLQVGGVSEPHKLIELARESGDTTPDTETLKKVKYHWLARNLVPDSNTRGLALDFRKYGCTGAGTCNPSYPYEDPALWNKDVDSTHGFFQFLDDAQFLYRDERRSTAASPVDLKIIEVDVGKLKILIEAHNHGPFLGLENDKAFILYIGLDESNGSTYDVNRFVVRLVNGGALPDYGLTIASNGFVQIAGDYNTAGYDTGDAVISPAEGAQCEMKPATVIADQIMALSNSWQDFNWDEPVPSNYNEPSDGITCGGSACVYPSPLMPSGNTYPWSDFRAHVIRSQTDVNTEINAMLVSGNVPDQLIAQEDYDTDQGLADDVLTQRTNKDYFVCSLTGIWSSSGYTHWLSRDRRLRNFQFSPPPVRSTYVVGREVRNQNFARSCINQVYTGTGAALTALNTSIVNNCVPAGITSSDKYPIGSATTLDCPNLLTNYGNSPDLAEAAQMCGADPTCMLNQQTDPSKAAAVISCMDTSFDAVPVKTVTYDPTTDVPIYTQIGTVGALFKNTGAAPCPNCNTFQLSGVTCDNCTSGTYTLSGVSMTLHRPGALDRDIPVFLRVDENGNIMTNIGTNHISENNANEYDNNRIKPGVRFASLAAFSANWNTPLTFPSATVAIGSCSCTQPQYQCGVNPERCGVHCPDPAGLDSNCPAGSACPAGEQNQCSYPSQCNQATCETNYEASPTCSGSCNQIQNFKFPASPQIVYTVGGLNRLMYSGNPSNNNYQTLKRQHLYIPYYKPIYSGGHENLVRLGENWNHWACAPGQSAADCSENGKNMLTILGTMHALWEAKTLIRNDGNRAYWSDSTYIAPERNFRYANTLRDDFCKPAGIPASIQLSVEGFQQE